MVQYINDIDNYYQLFNCIHF